MEGEGSDPCTLDANVPPPPPPPSEGVQGEQPADPPVPPTEDEAMARLLLQVGSPTHRHLEKVTSAPRPWKPAPLAQRPQTPKRRAPHLLGGCEEAAQGR